MAPIVERHPDLKAELENRYRSMAAGPGRTLVEHLFGEIADGDDVIVIVKNYIATGRGFSGELARALRGATLWHEPVPGGGASYYVRPASVAKLRKFLLEVAGGTAQEAALAERCLVEIDELRDEHGIAAGDPRHPDIHSSSPWPREAGRIGEKAG